jgi:hypothetical protein
MDTQNRNREIDQAMRTLQMLHFDEINSAMLATSEAKYATEGEHYVNASILYAAFQLLGRLQNA